MFIYIFILIFVIVFQVGSMRFLYQFFSLKKNGIKAHGTVTSFITYRYNVVLKNASIPKFLFNTTDCRKVINTPIHTFFIELSTFKIDNDYEIFYSKGNPEKFIVNNHSELWASISTVLASVLYLVWFFYMIRHFIMV